MKQKYAEQIFISLGSNTGNAKEHLNTALEKIRAYPKTNIKNISSQYQTEPQGDKEQNWFYNQVISLEYLERTSYALSKNKDHKEDKKVRAYDLEEAYNLLDFLLNIENEMGRIRDPQRRFGPRVIDLDIIFFKSICINTEKLTLPHPRFLERAFILIPLQEIVSGLILSKAHFTHVYPDTFLSPFFKEQESINLTQALSNLNFVLESNKIFQN